MGDRHASKGSSIRGGVSPRGGFSPRAGEEMPVKVFAASAMDRAEAAARRAVAPGRAAGQSALGVPHGAPWDPLGPKERLAVYLKATSELHRVGGALHTRHQQEEHLASLDRQIPEVEKTRA